MRIVGKFPIRGIRASDLEALAARGYDIAVSAGTIIIQKEVA